MEFVILPCKSSNNFPIQKKLIKIDWKSFSQRLEKIFSLPIIIMKPSSFPLLIKLFSKHNHHRHGVNVLGVLLIAILLFSVDNVFGIYSSKIFTIQPGVEYNVVDLEGSGFGFSTGGLAKFNFTTKQVCFDRISIFNL